MEDNSQQDSRFQSSSDGTKFFCPMCKGCGMCCVARDWSTNWLGNQVGICGNLNIIEGNCIDEDKKSIICKTQVCLDIGNFIQRLVYIASRNCPTANKLIAQMYGRKIDSFTEEEKETIGKILFGESKNSS